MSEVHKTTPATVPADWLLQVVELLHVMAGEGIGMEGCADPADLMVDLAERMGVGDADDPWQAAIGKIKEVAHAC